MLDAIEKYKQIKDSLDDIQSQGNNDEDFVKLVSMKGVDDELKETLILLHSNYKAETKEQKNILYRTLYRLIDQNTEVFIKINSLLEQQQKIKETSGGLFKMEALHKVLIAVVLTVISFFILAFIDPHAFNTAFGAMKDVVSLGAGSGGGAPAPVSQ